MYAFLTFEDEDDARALVESTKPHLIHGDTLNLAFASPMVKDGNKKKTAHGYFDDMMTQYMQRAMDGYFGRDLGYLHSFEKLCPSCAHGSDILKKEQFLYLNDCFILYNYRL